MIIDDWKGNQFHLCEPLLESNSAQQIPVDVGTENSSANCRNSPRYTLDVKGLGLQGVHH